MSGLEIYRGGSYLPARATGRAIQTVERRGQIASAKVQATTQVVAEAMYGAADLATLGSSIVAAVPASQMAISLLMQQYAWQVGAIVRRDLS